MYVFNVGENKVSDKANSSDSPTASDNNRNLEMIANKADESESSSEKPDGRKGQGVGFKADYKAFEAARQTDKKNNDQEKVPKQKPVAPTSWASLFKGTMASNTAVTYKMPAPQPKLEKADSTKKPVEEVVEPAVPVEDDKHARILAGW